MKQIASTYTYNKTSGVISLTGVNIGRDQLLLIVNTTRNVTYYNFADSTTTLQAFTQGANTSITLASSVVSASSAHNNADALTIYYDDQVSGIIALDRNGTPILFQASDDGAFDENGAAIQAFVRLFDENLVQYSVANPLPIAGAVTAVDLGAKADAVATTDTGTFSVIAFIKRGLQNWTSLLAKIPTLVSGRIPVDGSGVTQPVSLATAPTTPVTGTFWQTTQPVSGTFYQGTQPVSLASLPALVAGSAQIGSVSIALSTTPAVTTFTSITSATLIASNTSRKMLTIQNTGAGILYVLFGTGTASSTNFSLQMNSGDYYENGFYNGQVNAIFATAGTAYVTSLT